MLSSKQLIEITGISRATLNNYVALGILPNPVIKQPVNEPGRVTRLGYFDDNSVDCINRVKELKKAGMSMAQIANELSAVPGMAATSFTAKPKKVATAAGQGLLIDLSLDASNENFPGPAYLVNNNFELIWWNDKASTSFFSNAIDRSGDLESRNLLEVLLSTPFARNEGSLQEILKPHVAAGKKCLTQQTLFKIYSALDARQLSLLKDLYEDVEPVGKASVVHYSVILPGKNGDPSACDLCVCFYHEGILFTYSPIEMADDFLLNFLTKRDHVINALLEKGKHCLTNVTVLVASLENATRIYSELPAEEYFELINNIWQESEPIFSKYYGTHGKHASDGLVYYFFPQPDCDYKLNSIQCSLELQKMMKGITQKWQAKKGWFSDIYLNIGLNAGQEWFGSYHAGGHVEFKVLGETINHASRISDFARTGSVWACKNMLSQIPADKRKHINFGITRKSFKGASVFVADTYASLGSLLGEDQRTAAEFCDIATLPIAEVRAIGKLQD